QIVNSLPRFRLLGILTVIELNIDAGGKGQVTDKGDRHDVSRFTFTIVIYNHRILTLVECADHLRLDRIRFSVFPLRFFSYVDAGPVPCLNLAGVIRWM